MKIWNRTIEDTIYEASIIVCIGEWAAYLEYMKIRLNYSPVRDREPRGRVTEYLSDDRKVQEWYVWFPVWPDPPTPENFRTLAHESFHVTAHILRSRGLPLSEDSEEAYAYHHASIFDQLLKTVVLHDAYQRKKAERAGR